MARDFDEIHGINEGKGAFASFVQPETPVQFYLLSA
jgi:hypothetical protein